MIINSLELPFDFEGFSAAIDNFLQKDEVKNSARIGIDLSDNYKVLINNYVNAQKDAKIKESNDVDNDLCVFQCTVQDKIFVFSTSSKFTEIKVKLFKPVKDIKNRRKG